MLPKRSGTTGLGFSNRLIAGRSTFQQHRRQVGMSNLTETDLCVMKENPIFMTPGLNPGLCTLVAGMLLFAGAACLAEPLPKRPALQPGDILYADSGDAINGGFVIRIDPGTGQQSVVSSGGFLVQPFDLILTEDGSIVVSATSGRLVQVNPATGEQKLLADNTAGTLGMPCGMSAEKHGGILFANTEAILHLDLATGQTETVLSGGNILTPIAIAAANSGDLFVLNGGYAAPVVRVSHQSGADGLLTHGGYLQSPQGLVTDGVSLYITDMTTSPDQFAVGRVLRVDLRTGVQSVLAEGGYLVAPVGITFDANGNLVVGDPYIINESSPELYDGGIVRINSTTGAQTLVARGNGGHVNPRGVLVVPPGRANQQALKAK